MEPSCNERRCKIKIGLKEDKALKTYNFLVLIFLLSVIKPK